MYTSGSTGKPKGCQHRTGGYLAYVTGTSKYIQDIHPEDVYWCMADIGWITGHVVNNVNMNQVVRILIFSYPISVVASDQPNISERR